MVSRAEQMAACWSRLGHPGSASDLDEGMDGRVVYGQGANVEEDADLGAGSESDVDESQKGENGAQGEQAKGKAKAKAPLADRLDKLRRRLGPLPPEEKQMLVHEFRTDPTFGNVERALFIALS